jgi:hypothetical protein
MFLPQMEIDYLKIGDLAIVDVINERPHKGKLLILEPQDELFYKLKDPKKTLEKYLKSSHVVGVDYMIPIVLKIRTIYVKVVRIYDRDDHEVTFADINNIDLSVDFVPIPEGLRKPRKPKSKPKMKEDVPKVATSSNNVVRKHKDVGTGHPPPPTPPPPPIPSLTTQEARQSLYDPHQKWKPFCGWGRSLLSGEYVSGTPQ